MIVRLSESESVSANSPTTFRISSRCLRLKLGAAVAISLSADRTREKISDMEPPLRNSLSHRHEDAKLQAADRRAGRELRWREFAGGRPHARPRSGRAGEGVRAACRRAD